MDFTHQYGQLRNKKQSSKFSFFQLCQLPQNNIRETVVDIKANKIEIQIDDILAEVELVYSFFDFSLDCYFRV